VDYIYQAVVIALARKKDYFCCINYTTTSSLQKHNVVDYARSSAFNV